MIKIIIDSSCDFPEGFPYKDKFKILHLKISFGFETYIDKVNIDAEKFYTYLKSNKIFPKTSQISTNEFENAINKIMINKYDKIIIITVSSTLSGTYFSALQARELNKNKKNIYIIDGHLSILNAKLAIYAYDLIKKDFPIEKIVKLINIKKKEQKGIFSLETLDFLKRSGRINKIQFVIGGLLNIKPIIKIDENKNFKLIDKAKGDNQLFKKFLNYLNENKINNDPIDIVYSGEEGFVKIKFLKKYIKLNSEYKINSITQAGPSMGVHAGYGLIGIGF